MQVVSNALRACRLLQSPILLSSLARCTQVSHSTNLFFSGRKYCQLTTQPTESVKELYDKMLDFAKVKRSMPPNAWLLSMIINCKHHHHISLLFDILNNLRRFYLFDSLKDTIVMKCGHTMHMECYQEMIKRDKYCCPICYKSVIDMSRMWKRIDEEIISELLLIQPRTKKHPLQVWILCNDCNDTTEVYFHILGHKCGHCRSYNTHAIALPVFPQ